MPPHVPPPLCRVVFSFPDRVLDSLRSFQWFGNTLSFRPLTIKFFFVDLRRLVFFPNCPSLCPAVRNRPQSVAISILKSRGLRSPTPGFFVSAPPQCLKPSFSRHPFSQLLLLLPLFVPGRFRRRFRTNELHVVFWLVRALPL